MFFGFLPEKCNSKLDVNCMVNMNPTGGLGHEWLHQISPEPIYTRCTTRAWPRFEQGRDGGGQARGQAGRGGEGMGCFGADLADFFEIF